MNQSHQPHQDAKGSYIAQADRGGVAQVITNIFQGGSNEARELRNRQNMLQLVWNTWIEGVLKKSLYSEVLLELGLTTYPDAVEHPWNSVVQMPKQESMLLPPGMRMLEIFDQANGSLLILGEPGSGKTTMLLELARQAIERAQEDPIQPIPVMLNLSSWTTKQTIAEWIVTELKDKYYVSPKTSRPWVEKDELMLLLDGLDEVQADNREQCIRAINSFRTEHDMPLAVCSRRHEFEALSEKLKAYGAILIQPLTDQQMENYLETCGTDLARVKQVFAQDPEISEFARTPFILNIMVMAFRSASDPDVSAIGMTSNYRGRLFDLYIDKAILHRTSERQYPSTETKRWLGWLAQRMKMHSTSMFYIEQMQPTWLNNSSQEKRYRIISSILGGGFIGIINSALLWFIFGIIWPKIGMVSTGWVAIIGLVFGLFGSVIFVFMPGIHATESIGFSRNPIRRGLGLVLISLTLGISFVVINGWGPSWGDVLIIYYLACGSIPMLILGLIFLFERREIKIKTKPNQGIWQSIQNYIICLIVGVCVGMMGGALLSNLGGAWFWQPRSTPLSGWLTYGLSIGLAGASIAGIWFGFAAFVKHFYLRWVLYIHGSLPWNLVRFLDYANDCVLLRKVGGGYIYIHRMLMDHFAERDYQLSKDSKGVIFPRKKVALLATAIFVIGVCLLCPLVYPDGHRGLLASFYAIRGWRVESSHPEKAYLYYLRASELIPHNADYSNNACRFGSLSGHAAEVLAYCEQAVHHYPSSGRFRDSRGLARALTGNYNGAIEDFRFFIEWSKQFDYIDEKETAVYREEREAWILKLEAGYNPFDEETLRVLLHE